MGTVPGETECIISLYCYGIFSPSHLFYYVIVLLLIIVYYIIYIFQFFY